MGDRPRGREWLVRHGVGASNLPGAGDRLGSRRCHCCPWCWCFGEGALSSPHRLAGRSAAPGRCSPPSIGPTCAGRGFCRDTLTVVAGRCGLPRPGSLGGSRRRQPPCDVQCSLLLSPAPRRLWGPRCKWTHRQSTGVGAGPGPGAVCRECARARSQAAPGETIARTAGERGEAISRTAGALHGVRGSPAPARTAAQAAGSSRRAESPSRPSWEGGAAGTWAPSLPLLLPPSLPSSLPPASAPCSAS